MRISIVLPLIVLVSRTWVVFWMDDETSANRVSISFVGILSVVAYYFVILDSVPEISYLTLMDAFILATFFMLAASVGVNLLDDRLNRSGRRELGDRVDQVCRWGFPIGYAVLTLLVLVIFFNLELSPAKYPAPFAQGRQDSARGLLSRQSLDRCAPAATSYGPDDGRLIG